MATYKTEYANFMKPCDLLRYMQEEGIEKVHVTLEFCGETLGIENDEMTIHDVERWIKMSEEV